MPGTSFLGGMDFGSAGGAVSSIFGAIGDFQNASSLKKASKMAMQNARISAESTAIQQTQAQREVLQTIGRQQAQVGGAGLAASGSALDLLRSSQSQGELTKQLIGVQGKIDENDWKLQSQNYAAQAAAAKTSGIGGILGGVMKGVGAIAPFLPMLSDATLKENIVYVGPGTLPGVNRYTFRYLGGEHTFVGVLAQEVEKVRPDAVHISRDGFRMVDYAAIGERLELI